MSNPDFNQTTGNRANSRSNASDTKPKDDGLGSRAAGMARDTVAGASSMAGEMAESAKERASETASSLMNKVNEVVDHQIGSGADQAHHLARSAKRVADDMNTDAPQLASLMRSSADYIDTLADKLQEQSMQDLLRGASDFTRRQPALVFGVAALAGFVALRMMKSASSGGGTRRHHASGDERMSDDASRHMGGTMRPGDTAYQGAGPRSAASPRSRDRSMGQSDGI